jgi:uncharacterized protein (DUF2237 family)
MALNVLGTELQECSIEPLTGFFRDGCCNTNAEDTGMHTVCVQVTEEFLAFSKSVGNDLSTAVPEYEFYGLKDGDRWCLCMPRWIEAYNSNAAPRVVLEATHVSVLEHIDLEILQRFAVAG